MEEQHLAGDLVAFLSPLLPYLKVGGEELSKKIASQLGEGFQAVWKKIFSAKKVEQAAKRLAEQPDAQEAQVDFCEQLQTLMEYNAELADELQGWIKHWEGTTTVTDNSISIVGHNNKVATGGSVILNGNVGGDINLGSRG